MSVICSAQNPNIRHLNMKINRLNRITNVLQKDVVDIWTTLSSTDTSDGINLSNNTMDEMTSQSKMQSSVIKQVNETVADVQELKTEVEQLVLYAKTGLKNEKKLHREAVKNLKKSQQEFQVGLAAEAEDMKRNLDKLAEKQEELQEEDRICKLQIENLTTGYTTKITEIEVKSEECHKRVDNLIEKSNALERSNNVMTDQFGQLEQQITTILLRFFADGWKSHNNHWYCVVSDPKTWDQASAYCQSQNSYLVELTTDKEIQFVSALAENVVFWIGANDREREGTFIWQNSEQHVAGKNWNPDEPNNTHGREDCATMYSKTGKFNDVPCDVVMVFVCEMEMTN